MTFQQHLDSVRVLLGRAEWDAARAELDAAEALAADDAQLELVQLHRASIAVLRGDEQPDLRVFRESFVRRRSAHHVTVAGYYLLVHLLNKGDVGTAERYLAGYLAAVRELGDPDHLAVSRDIESTVDSMRGRHLAAIERHRASLQELETYAGPDMLLLRVMILHNLIYDCLAANRFAEALESVDACVRGAEEIGRADWLAQVLTTCAFAQLCADRLDEAARLARRAEPYVAGVRLERYAHYVLGEVARRRGDRDEAAAHFRRVEEFYPDIPGVAEMLLTMNVAPFLLPE